MDAAHSLQERVHCLYILKLIQVIDCYELPENDIGSSHAFVGKELATYSKIFFCTTITVLP